MHFLIFVAFTRRIGCATINAATNTEEVIALKDTIQRTLSLSEPDRYLMAEAPVPMQVAGEVQENTLVIDPREQHQSILGLGGIITDTDLYALLRMNPEKQEEALQAIFNPETGMGYSLMRVPLGSTDWEVTPDFYTYDDMPKGEKDWELRHFSIQRDIDRGLFRVLRRGKEINPALRFFGSVWGMPAWMKDNDSIMYGRFDPACTDVYARYLAKTAKAFQEQGIDLYAVTPQNESLTSNDRATPATRMTWWVQRDLVKAMRRELDLIGCKDTQVWIYDHNYDMSDFFVKPLLADEEARKAIGGVAFHDYGGDPCVMEELYRQYPDVSFYLTERTITTVGDMDNLVRELRAGARSYSQWTTMSDEYGGPHVFLGKPFVYNRPPAPMERRNFLYNLRKEPNQLFRSPAYGIYGTFSRYLKPGMVRIDSTYGRPDWVTSVAFQQPGTQEIAVICVNQTDSAQPVTLRCGGGEASFTQPAGSVCAYRFTPGSLCESAVCEVTESPVIRQPAWDIAVVDIRLNGPEKAGAALPLSAIVQNVGELPTPEGAVIRVDFSEDGDCPIARSFVPLPVLQSGETYECVSTVPMGMPYFDRVAWTAEKGHHQIFARAEVGNVFPETWVQNNVLAREYDFE